MKNWLTIPPRGLTSARMVRTSLLFFLVFALASAFWIAALPAALGRDLTPTEMVQDGLPFAQTMKSATKSEFLAAICAAVRKQRKAAAAITPMAVTAHPEFAGDIVGTVLRCSSKVDCEFVGAIVAAATSADRSAATAIGDAAIAKAPNCAETIQKATRRMSSGADNRANSSPAGSTDQSPSPGANGETDEGFDPHEQLDLVCDNGMQRTVRVSQVGDFLQAHPGSFTGACKATPTPTPTSTPAPTTKK